MTAPRQRVIVARERFALYRELNRLYVDSFVRSAVLALPLILLAAPSMWRILGFVYLGLWIPLVAASTGAMFALLYDALLMIRNRNPVILPQLLFARNAARHNQEQRRAIQRFHRFAVLAYWANPLANVTVAAMLFAFRMRPNIVRRVAALVADWQQEEEKIVIGGEPTVEYISPAIDHAVAPAVGAPSGRQQEMQFA